jgi:uncharacterized paraquat-inducible protein A
MSSTWSQTDWTCVQDMGDAHEAHYLWLFWRMSLKTTECFSSLVFGWVWASKLGGAVPKGTEGGTWRHCEGCVEAKQLREKCVAVRCIFQELVHFSPVKWMSSMYILKSPRGG